MGHHQNNKQVRLYPFLGVSTEGPGLDLQTGHLEIESRFGKWGHTSQFGLDRLDHT